MASIFTSLVRKAPRLINLRQPVTQNVRSLSISNALYSPRIQEPAPEFEGIACHEDKFKNIKLSDYKGKYVLLVFYPLDFTFVCPTELIALETYYDDFRKMECEVIGVSVDSHYTHLAWQNTPREVSVFIKFKCRNIHESNFPMTVKPETNFYISIY
ncbi:hypothetical protein AMK59_2526 [Oryctes borbonicus]|uniref:thioredoxin-dependent peroxiredoxin n=1 Tax=Oryctes borbonicus TaxID=1629725 RepID=A0A0T6BDS1_9SCAR|nr:hypothetical protein AMK59_2526 [Oryctes borbonicus]